MTGLRTCVGEDGHFIVGVHEPQFHVKNLRRREHLVSLGCLEDGTVIDNAVNFPAADLFEPNADTIFEIANPFPFRGATFINSAWADPRAGRPDKIRIPPKKPCSLLKNMEAAGRDGSAILDLLPQPLLVALAQASTDPDELACLAQKSCHILMDPDTGAPHGIGFVRNRQDEIIPDIRNHELFEVLVNNPYLPDPYKQAMVLKPGVQGKNEITGEYKADNGRTHVFEYLRRNSYIPWGHFASNMANDAIRYSTKDLDADDMAGIRHLYYQRAFVRLARELGLSEPDKRDTLSETELETLRLVILSAFETSGKRPPFFDATLWGWNFGYGYAQSGHRLHASHQMIHQQNAMVPGQVKTADGKHMTAFSCGDLISDFIQDFRKQTGKGFFNAYLSAIHNNTRTDGTTKGEASLVVAEDDHSLLFVPKAQVSEWELQLVTKSPCGNIFETDSAQRRSLDRAILMAVKTLEAMGADMVTSIEFSKRFGSNISDQHLVYAFIPRLPYAPGTFSEAQLRWISGAYPEDVAHACRTVMETLE